MLTGFGAASSFCLSFDSFCLPPWGLCCAGAQWEEFWLPLALSLLFACRGSVDMEPSAKSSTGLLAVDLGAVAVLPKQTHSAVLPRKLECAVG